VGSLRKWFKRAREQEVALEQSGLPDCPWQSSQIELASTASGDKLARLLNELETHAESCSICRAREQFLLDRFGKQLPPPTWLQRIRPIGQLIQRHGRLGKAAAALLFVGVILALGLAIRLLPHLELMEIPVYLLAMLGLAVSAFAAYQSIGLLQWAGLLGRWIANCCAGIGGMIVFVWVFRLSGYASAFSRENVAGTIGEDMTMALFLGFLYGTFVPLVVWGRAKWKSR
jgi:hypothetical protein